MKKLFLFCLALMFGIVEARAQKDIIPSGIYDGADNAFEKGRKGKQKNVIEGPTKTLENFSIQIITLDPGKTMKSRIPESQEAFLLVKKGRLGVKINSKKHVTGPNSVVLLAKGDDHAMYNPGTSAVEYYQVQLDSKIPTDLQRGKVHGGSEVIEFKEMEFEKNQKGGRRHVMRKPTASLRELEMHITTLDEGVTSHEPHVHKDEEIIVVFKGKVEEMINGEPHEVEPGSIIYLSSMDPHGIRNIGEGQCEYYAIRWVSTPE